MVDALNRGRVAMLVFFVCAAVHAQENDLSIPAADLRLEVGRWQMFSPAGEGVFSSVPFLYDTVTGRVWRFFSECGDDAEDANGCLVEVPTYPPAVDMETVLDALTQAIEEAVQDMDKPGSDGN